MFRVDAKVAYRKLRFSKLDASTGYRFITGALKVNQKLNERFSASVCKDNVSPGNMALKEAVSVDSI
jgi:hypothetical protein